MNKAAGTRKKRIAVAEVVQTELMQRGSPVFLHRLIDSIDIQERLWPWLHHIRALLKFTLLNTESWHLLGDACAFLKRSRRTARLKQGLKAISFLTTTSWSFAFVLLFVSVVVRGELRQDDVEEEVPPVGIEPGRTPLPC